MIGLLFAASVALESPQGGLSEAPIDIAERAADGVLWLEPRGGNTYIALAD
jgi:hypothetical protein